MARPLRGRTLFQFIEPLLKICTAVLQLFPRPLCNMLFIWVRHLPTIIGVGLRYILLARLCKRCGRCVAVYEGVFLLGLKEIEIGDNVSFNPMTYIDGHGGLAIGNNVSIAHGTTLMTTEHDFSQVGIHTRDTSCFYKNIIVGDDVWLGCGVRILAGVEIGEGAVVGAGAVVNRDVPASTIVAGIPAKVIRANTKSASSATKSVA